jgi:hypothetical protein
MKRAGPSVFFLLRWCHSREPGGTLAGILPRGSPLSSGPYRPMRSSETIEMGVSRRMRITTTGALQASVAGWRQWRRGIRCR